MKSIIAMLMSLSIFSFSALAEFAKPDVNAKKGGNFTFNLGAEPPTLHPIMSTDNYATKVRGFLGDALATRSSETYDWIPRIAEKWETSKDGKVFTFFLRKDAFFHDGKPVTAEDVKFSFDAIFEPKYEAAHLRPYYEGITKVEIIDPYTIKAYAKDTYFLNFDVMASLEVIPKHVYSDVEKSKKMNREYIGSGPYKLEKFDRGQMLVLKRFDKWYGTNLPDYKFAYNYDTMTLRFYKEETVILEHAKKGNLDYVDDMRPESYAKKVQGDPWGKTVFAKKVENYGPKLYSFIGWNLRKEIFQDRNVRIALAHLMNRKEMIKKFFFDYHEPARGPVFNKSEFADPAVKAIEFDPKKAKDLLAKAGWKDEDKNGVLEKNINGKKTELKFSLSYANKDTEKYWTLYQEDLKKAGVELELRFVEWNAFLKALDDNVAMNEKNEYKNPPAFDAIAMRWGGGSLSWDPKQIWHSASAIPGGSNFIAYKNAEVDKLIDQARYEISKEKRRNMLRKVYSTIAADAPYLFFASAKYEFYAVSARVKQVEDTFKYDFGSDFWSIKP
jgi:microcin C transport system substrate-binding protein